MKLLITAALLFVCSTVRAEVLEVNIWKPMPGKIAATIQSAQEARAIQEELGANVSIGVDFEGQLHYAASFENWQAWAKWVAKLNASEAWAAWQAKASQNPAAVHEDNYLLNVPASGDLGVVYQVFIWDPPAGRIGPLVQAAMEAKAIHEKSGVSVAINVDQMQRMHYVMGYDSWDEWAKVQDTPNEEFDRFMQKQNQNPTGELVKVYTAEVVQ